MPSAMRVARRLLFGERAVMFVVDGLILRSVDISSSAFIIVFVLLLMCVMIQ